ncbi:MAG: hypothetical protein AAFU50_10020, partial [Pseudomonadota bacterium]
PSRSLEGTADTITDFVIGEDVISFEGEAMTYEDLLIDTDAVSGHVVVTAGTHAITLEGNTDADAMTASNFVF